MDKKRASYTVRLQPDFDTPLGEVARWLSSHNRARAKFLVEQALIMAYLAYAKADGGDSFWEVERCCWETQDLLDKHGFNQRQALRVFPHEFQSKEFTDSIKKKSDLNSSTKSKIVEKINDENENIYNQISNIFGDEG